MNSEHSNLAAERSKSTWLRIIQNVIQQKTIKHDENNTDLHRTTPRITWAKHDQKLTKRAKPEQKRPNLTKIKQIQPLITKEPNYYDSK